MPKPSDNIVVSLESRKGIPIIESIKRQITLRKIKSTIRANPNITVERLSNKLDMPKSTLYYHLKILEAKGSLHTFESTYDFIRNYNIQLAKDWNQLFCRDKGYFIIENKNDIQKKSDIQAILYMKYAQQHNYLFKKNPQNLVKEFVDKNVPNNYDGYSIKSQKTVMNNVMRFFKPKIRQFLKFFHM